MHKDSNFNSFLIFKLINTLMLKGKKEKLEISIYLVLKYIKYKFKFINPLFLFFEIFELLKSILGLIKVKFFKKKKIVIKYLPFKIKIFNSYNLSFKWFKFGILSQKRLNLKLKIFNELLNILVYKQGISVQKKLENFKYII